MPSLSFNAFIALLICVLAGAAAAQPAYRCGNSYSQTPCPQAIVIESTDQRTPSQKAQADQATARDARTADAMQKARLQQEAINRANNTPPAIAASAARPAASAPRTSHFTKKKKAAPSATTRAAGVTQKKQAARRPAAKKVEAQP